MDIQLDDVEVSEFRGDPRRWIVIFLFILQQLIDTMIWLTFAPIALETSVFYEVSISLVNGLSSMFLALFLPGMLCCSYLLVRHGLRHTVLMAAGLHATAAFIRWSSVWIPHQYKSFAFPLLFLGQAMAAIASPICSNLPVRLAGDWFTTQERDQATTLGNLGFGLGNVVGMCLPGVFVSQVASASEHAPVADTGVTGMGALLCLEFVLALLAFIWTWFCFAEEPAQAPSPTALQQRQQRVMRKMTKDQHADWDDATSSAAQVLNDYRELLKNADFMIVLFSFAVSLGLFNSLVTVLEQLLHPCGYGSHTTGIIANAMVAGGIPTSWGVAILLDRTHAYNAVFKVVYACTCLATIAFCLSIRPDQILVIIASAVAMGAAGLPLLPVSLEVAAEVTYPVSEESSTGLLMFAGNSAGVGLTFLYGVLIPMAPQYDGNVWTPAAMLTIALFVLATLVVFTFRGESRRHQADLSASNKSGLLSTTSTLTGSEGTDSTSSGQ